MLFDHTYYTEGRYMKPFIGSIISSAAGLIGQKSAEDAADDAADKANAFTVEQWKNKHKWETEDLEKAGLNRILSSTNGSSSVGSSAQAQVFNAADSMSKAADSGTKAVEANTKKKVAEEQRKNLQADTALKKSQSVNQLAGAEAQSAQAALAHTDNAQKSRYTPIHQRVGSAFSSVGKAFDAGNKIIFDGLKNRSTQSSAKSSYKPVPKPYGYKPREYPPNVENLLK